MSRMNTTPIQNDFIFKKNDPDDLRVGNFCQQSVVNHNPDNNPILNLIGYPDDEGVKLNGGREGAKLASVEVRKKFYKLTPPQNLKNNFIVVDEGNLHTENKSLIEKHEIAYNLALQFWSGSNSKARVSIGAGHDYGYPDCKAYIEYYLGLNIRPLIINLDAHLDVRPFTTTAHSGTPFYRILSEFAEDIDFYEVGIQPQCNSKVHLDWAQAKNAKIFFLDAVENKSLISLIEKPNANILKRPVFLSIDMDAIRSSEAPGVSAPANFGLTQYQVRDLIFDLHKNFDFRAMGIYEINPLFDIDHKTSHLAAQFIYDFFFNWRQL